MRLVNTGRTDYAEIYKVTKNKLRRKELFVGGLRWTMDGDGVDFYEEVDFSANEE